MKVALKKLITEEIRKVQLEILEENIVSDIMALILSPKVKKAMKTLKNDPDFKELETQIKRSKEEAEAIAKRIEHNMEKREKAVSDMQKAGIKVTTSMDAEQTFRAYKDWQSKMNKAHKIGKTGISDWEKYFK